jgi:ADP-ribose 1''-phosphate phosphatase
MIIYKKMSLFDAPEGAMLIHGCNARGIWGAGIAAAFKSKYPRSFQDYADYCERCLNVDKEYGSVGTACISGQENKRFVVSLITSFDFGHLKDSPAFIVAQTYLALSDFFALGYKHKYKDKPIYCNKFNSGMFKVPWHETEKVLRYFSERYKVDITVCDPDMI